MLRHALNAGEFIGFQEIPFSGGMIKNFLLRTAKWFINSIFNLKGGKPPFVFFWFKMLILIYDKIRKKET